MRDSEGGFQAALKTESSPAVLVVRQRYVERYPNNFLARLDLARTLSQYGSFSKALEQYAEIDRLDLATTPEERQSVLFHRAWALQGSNRRSEADQVWTSLSDAKDFYLRSAADWFLGENALKTGKVCRRENLVVADCRRTRPKQVRLLGQPGIEDTEIGRPFSGLNGRNGRAPNPVNPIDDSGARS